MPRPYSNDLRERVVLAVRSGETCRFVANRFGVSVSSVVRWSRRHRATGSVSPDKISGYRRPVPEPYRDFIIEQVGRTPHLTLHVLKTLLAERGIEVSHQTVWAFLRREGLSFKCKRPVSPTLFLIS
jgi:putative transposase